MRKVVLSLSLSLEAITIVTEQEWAGDKKTPIPIEH